MQSINQPNQDSREANLIESYTKVWELKKEVKISFQMAETCQNLLLRNELKMEAAKLDLNAECLLKEVLDCVDVYKGVLVC